MCDYKNEYTHLFFFFMLSFFFLSFLLLIIFLYLYVVSVSGRGGAAGEQGKWKLRTNPKLVGVRRSEVPVYYTTHRCPFDDDGLFGGSGASCCPLLLREKKGEGSQIFLYISYIYNNPFFFFFLQASYFFLFLVIYIYKLNRNRDHIIRRKSLLIIYVYIYVYLVLLYILTL